jgi:type I restriction enzyme M protein
MTDLQDFSRSLFAAANQLWTNTALRPDQYGQPVLALIALRQMEAKFETVHAELAPLYKGRLKPKPSDYQARGAIFLPENARFSRLLSLPGTANLGAELNAAMKGIADANPDLAGALPQGYAGLPNDVLQELLCLFDLSSTVRFRSSLRDVPKRDQVPPFLQRSPISGQAWAET